MLPPSGGEQRIRALVAAAAAAAGAPQPRLRPVPPLRRTTQGPVMAPELVQVRVQVRVRVRELLGLLGLLGQRAVVL